MPPKQNRKKTQKKIGDYNVDLLKSSIARLLNGELTRKEAAKILDCPYTTFSDWISLLLDKNSHVNTVDQLILELKVGKRAKKVWPRMWCSTSPDFNLETFFDHLRATKPPYYCPYPKCEKKVYRSFSGMEKHISSQHKEEIELEKPKESAGIIDIPTPAIALSPSRMVPPAQRLFDVEVDGRVWRLNVLEPLQIVSVHDKDLDNDSKADNVLDRYKKSVLHSPSVQPPAAKFKVLDIVKKKVEPLAKEYLKFTPQTTEMLDKMVEYDMDEEDYMWLDLVNKKRETGKFESVPELTFEYLMDRLEKECQFQVNQQSCVDEDAVCCVCVDGECHNANVILFCDMCNIAVHQDCYGVPYVPEGQWLCRRCQLSPSRAVDCCLCPNKGGAFKQTSEGLWCHVVCAIWVPDVYFANTVFLEPVEGIDKVHHARYKLKCIVCKEKGVGACIQCHKPSCYVAFHVSCAQSAKLYMKVETSHVNGPGSPVVKKYVYCDMHAPNSRGHSEQSIQAKKQDSLKKLRYARKILSQRRNSVPTVSIPVIPVKNLNKISGKVDINDAESFIRQVVAYWTLKRQSRFGVPLLRRLQVFHQKQQMQTKEESGTTPELKRQLKHWKHIRNNLEKARLLCELLRKRERLKRDYVESACDLVDYQLKPVSSSMVDVIDKIEIRDRFRVFTQPVSEEEVPGYSTVIDTPMDLSTMRKKAEKGQYKNFIELQADFKLIIDNCVKFNPKGEFFWKQAQRIRRLGNQVIAEARQEEIGAPKTTKKKPTMSAVTLALPMSKDLSPFPEMTEQAPKPLFSPMSNTSEEPKSPPKSAPLKKSRPQSLALARKVSATPTGRATAGKQLNKSFDSKRAYKRKALSLGQKGPIKKMKREPEIVELSMKQENDKPVPLKKPPKIKKIIIPKKGSKKRKKAGALVQTNITKFLSVTDSKERESSPDYLPTVNDKTNFSQYRQNEPVSPASVPSSSEDSGLDESMPSTSYAPEPLKKKSPKGRKSKAEQQELQVIDVTGVRNDCVDFQFMDLVWAPFPGGSVHLPALVHQESQKSKIYANVLPIHPAPQSVLNQRPLADEPIKLVRFFDDKRTWRWCGVSELLLFGIDDIEDDRLTNQPKKHTDKLIVTECVDRATFARNLIMGETPADRLLVKYGEEEVESELEDDNEDNDKTAKCSLM